ncbi:MAG: 50S ribosomal protein L9 [Synergistaceae bacterium]|jgi:large subunit ribosomal protein L9|nr:50S ribosomal protein L9 [Synergistaceae bacterium]
MKVILKQDVKKVGIKGEILEVSDGYARNYLIARGLAEEATSGKIRENKELKKAQKEKDDKKLSLAEAAKSKITGKVVLIKSTTGDGEKLFGSVTTAQIADQIASSYSVIVDKKDIKLDDVVKQVGTYPFKVRLYTNVEADMTLKVETE